jgi:hypothetical protein
MQANQANRVIKFLKGLCLVMFLFLMATNMFWGYQYFQQQAICNERSYVITDFGTFSAHQMTGARKTAVEARNHIKVFMTNMYAHEANNFKDRVETALELIDKEDGLAIYNDFKEGQVYENYVRNNARTRIEVDSVLVDMDVQPYQGRVYAKQTIFYNDQSRTLPIAAAFNLVETPFRTDQNPFGMLIQNWKYIVYNLDPES